MWSATEPMGFVLRSIGIEISVLPVSGALTPASPHMTLPIVVVALIAITALFWVLGMRSFLKRAVG